MNLKEFDRLEGLLKMNGIRYERIDLKSAFNEHHEIFYPSRAWHTADAILDTYSEGHEEGLLEYFGELPNGQTGIQGEMTADEIFERLKGYEYRHIQRELRRLDLCGRKASDP